jgi:hypothetical protein
MATTRALTALSLFAAMALAQPARAADEEGEALLHGRRSFELTFLSGYAQGAGRLRTYADQSVLVTGPGAAFGAKFGFRGNPFISVALGGDFAMYSTLDPWHPQDQEHRLARAMSVALDLEMHAAGLAAPWGGLGLGYRSLWVPQPDTLAFEHGPELLRLAGGVDFVAADGVALGPWAGADLGMLTWRHGDDVENGVTLFFQLGLRAVLNFESMAYEPPRPVRVAK